jgi:integrase
MSAPNPTAAIIMRQHHDQPFYEAKFRHEGRQVKRRIGPAWIERDPDKGGWRPRRGRVPEGAYNEARAHVAAAQLVADYVTEQADVERVERERSSRGVTFREVAHDYLRWMSEVAGARPSTLRDHKSVLGEPGVSYKRGAGVTCGYVMAALGDRPAAKVTTRDVEAMLAAISDTGASPRTVNKYRSVVSAVFSFGCKPSTFALPANPTKDADRRRQSQPGALDWYTPEQVEAVARALDKQDAELVRLAAYAGLRLGELLALRWRDVDFEGSALTVERALSAGVEGATKSGRMRRVPLADQAAAALARQGQRQHFVSRDDLVFVNPLGRSLDGSALRRRFRLAQDAAGVRRLRLHDLRHSFGSRLAASGIDVVTIQAAMGHSTITTTSRYLHARPAGDQARVFSAAFSTSSPDAALSEAVPD